MRIPLSSPDITETEVEAVVHVLRSSRLSLGPKLLEFESAIAKYVSADHAVGFSSGTAGLCLGLEALNIGEGDEVIVPSFTFVAAANAIRYVRATPVFVDIDPFTLNLRPDAVQSAVTPRTRAILVVHTFGCPANMGPLLEIAHKHNIHLIEDACEAIGAEWDGHKVGPLGTFGVFSFYPNKPITTGEGGVLVTNDAELASKVSALRNQGRRQEDAWNQHSFIGYNHRLPEINCALGLAQLSRIEGILSRRETLAGKYSKLLGTYCPDVELPALDISNGRISWFVYVVRLRSVARDQVIQQMASQGIGCRAYFPPIHKMRIYAAYSNVDLPVTDAMSSKTVALPFFNNLSDDQMLEVSRTLAQVTSALRNM